MMKHLAILGVMMIAFVVPATHAAVEDNVSVEWEQCGGIDWNGPFLCAEGLVCEFDDEDFSQCVIDPELENSECSGIWDQCGGRGWEGPTCCSGRSSCIFQSEHYSQCEDTMFPSATDQCSTGVFTSNVCCEARCESCGGSGCGLRDGGGQNCCTTKIRAANRSCIDNEPPCVIQDDRAPVITLVGDAVVEVAMGETYEDAGATAYDDIEGDITRHIEKIGLPLDTLVTAGTFTVTYTVSDNAGNVAVDVIRTVIVRFPSEAESIFPTALEQCSTGVFTSNICCQARCGTCGGSQCSQRDGGGENCCVTKIRAANKSCEGNEPPCVIQDSVAPIITLVGDAVVEVAMGATYTETEDAGAAEAMDDVEGDITRHIEANGLPVDTSAVGTFTVTYSVSDNAGNVAVDVIRTVIVYFPSEDEQCPANTGIWRLGGQCCEARCGSCGGDGCMTRDGGPDACCASNIEAANKSCIDNEPPCMLQTESNDDRKDASINAPASPNSFKNLQKRLLTARLARLKQ